VQFSFIILTTLLAACTSTFAIPITGEQSRSIEARGAPHWEISGWKAVEPATGTRNDFPQRGHSYPGIHASYDQSLLHPDTKRAPSTFDVDPTLDSHGFESGCGWVVYMYSKKY
jgi:hypothetical protein